MSGLQIGLFTVFGCLLLAGLGGCLLMLFRLGQASPPEGADRDHPDLENRLERLERAFRALELEWVNTHSKVRAAIGRLSREEQVAEGKHKGGALAAAHEISESQEPLSNRDLEIMLRRGDHGSVR